MKTKDELPDCPVATTVSLIGSKWKLLIIRDLMNRTGASNLRDSWYYCVCAFAFAFDPLSFPYYLSRV